MKRERSRLLILSHIAQFGLARGMVGGHVWGSSTTNFREDCQVGDLVAIQSARPSKWYLSWVHSTQRPINWACDQYTLESIEDGQLCNWHNVSLIHLNREEVKTHPEWRWTDEQHEFKDRWFKACYKRCDAHMHIPLFPVFHANGIAVSIGLRGRHGFCEPSRTITIDNSKRVSLKALVAAYKMLSKEMDDNSEKARRELEANITPPL